MDSKPENNFDEYEEINDLSDDTFDSEAETVVNYEADGSEAPPCEQLTVEDEQISGDVLVYQLNLPYSNETLLGTWKKEDPLKPHSMVLVPTKYGKDLAVVLGSVKSKCGAVHVYKIERVATDEDIQKSEIDKKNEKEAFKICKERIEALKLDMKLVTVHYLFEDAKILFFFTADDRVDFRELVKDLVSTFRTRIELRQIGIRDESRLVGGLGICGRNFCCNAICEKLKPVSIKMAKDQNLSLNSMKISGTCGRLLCCLAYEHNYYAEERSLVPGEGSKMQWDGSMWKVQEINLVRGFITLCSEDGRFITLPKDRFEKKDTYWIIKDK